MDSTPEYAELGANMRHYSEMRLKRLTVFLAATGALLAGLFTAPEVPMIWIGVPVLGLVLTLSLWVLVKNIDRYYWSFRGRAVELEKQLGFAQYGGLPANLRSSFFIGLIFATCVFVWLVMLVNGLIQWIGHSL